MKNSRLFLIWIGIAIFFYISGCTEEVTNNSYYDNGQPGNQPPKILLWGPEYDSLAHFDDTLPPTWVIVGDPDGSDDIAAVMLTISSINIVSLIVRPDDSTNECSEVYYAPMDTINVLPYLRNQIFNVTNQVMQNGIDGYYYVYLTYNLLTDGGIVNDGDVFGQAVKLCTNGLNYLYMIEQFGLYPPALPAPRDVFVTYAEFLISGLSITVYDQSGASEKITRPDFYIRFSNSTEDQTLP